MEEKIVVKKKDQKKEKRGNVKEGGMSRKERERNNRIREYEW